jgi:hypothetical protein
MSLRMLINDIGNGDCWNDLCESRDETSVEAYDSFCLESLVSSIPEAFVDLRVSRRTSGLQAGSDQTEQVMKVSDESIKKGRKGHTHLRG